MCWCGKPGEHYCRECGEMTCTEHDCSCFRCACPCHGGSEREAGEFTSCDRCGLPYWEHTHEERLPRWDDVQPFRLGEPMELVPITAERAQAVRRKWSAP